MKYGDITSRLANLGGDKWAVHLKALKMKADGADIVIASIGEPEIPPSPILMQSCHDALTAGRAGYSNGQGETDLLQTLAKRYAARSGRAITSANVMTVPGTQTALYLTMMGLLNPGDEVLVGDPFYVSYEGVVAAPGGRFVPVPMSADNGFRLQARDIAPHITPRSRAILLTTPHNPTGAVLRPEDLRAIGDLAKEHDLWIISDEVYAELVFDGAFTSPLDFADLAERTIVVSSISKSHAAPGFRSGWIVAPEEFVSRVLPLSETILFGNQPFIADATEAALLAPNTTAQDMRSSYRRRAQMLVDGLADLPSVRISLPDAGMFVMFDIRDTGRSGEAFAEDLLAREAVSVLPGEVFGTQGAGFVRISLTITDTDMQRVVRGLANVLKGVPA
ncbi:pyridoxal phosphate-dependent aminotransferase [Shimia sp.]|uniref:pyridoxal phosphate-dependent aminotransferase n=1 Tax=Shimia sp. TaxID=1954381 RepID=UPI003BAAF1BE